MADLTATEPPQLSRSLSLGGASAISTGLAFAAINFLAWPRCSPTSAARCPGSRSWPVAC